MGKKLVENLYKAVAYSPFVPIKKKTNSSLSAIIKKACEINCSDFSQATNVLFYSPNEYSKYSTYFPHAPKLDIKDKF